MSKLVSIIFILVIFSISHIYGQPMLRANRFILKGRIIGRVSGTVVLWYHDKENEVVMDTAILNNGRFTVKGTINRACEALLWTDPTKRNFDDSSVIHFILESNNVTINYKVADPLRPEITGSPAQLEKASWDKAKSSLISLRWQLYKTRDSLNNKSIDKRNQVLNKIGEVSKKIRLLDIQYIRTHPHIYLSGYLLAQQMSQIAVDTLQALYSELSTNVKMSSIGYTILSDLYPLTNDNEFRKANPLVNKELDEQLRSLHSIYDLSLTDTAGNVIALDFLRGKYVIIDFWASWCKPCVENMSTLNKMVKDYQSDSILFVSISLDSDSGDWKRAIIKYHCGGIQLSDLNGFQSLAAIYCKAIYVPTYIAVNKNGQIIRYDAHQALEPMLRASIDRLVGHTLPDRELSPANN